MEKRETVHPKKINQRSDPVSTIGSRIGSQVGSQLSQQEMVIGGGGTIELHTPPQRPMHSKHMTIDVRPHTQGNMGQTQNFTSTAAYSKFRQQNHMGRNQNQGQFDTVHHNPLPPLNPDSEMRISDERAPTMFYRTKATSASGRRRNIRSGTLTSAASSQGMFSVAQKKMKNNRLRIALPPSSSQTNGLATQQRQKGVSSHAHYQKMANQAAADGAKEAQIAQERILMAAKENPKKTELEEMLLPVPGIGNYMIRNTRQLAYQSNIIHQKNLIPRPYGFLSNIGGQTTTRHRMTLETAKSIKERQEQQDFLKSTEDLKAFESKMVGEYEYNQNVRGQKKLFMTAQQSPGPTSILKEVNREETPALRAESSQQSQVQFRHRKNSSANILGGHRPSHPVNTTVHFKDQDHHIIHSEGPIDMEEDSIMNQAEQTQDQELGMFCKQIMDVRPHTSSMGVQKPSSALASSVKLKWLVTIEDNMPYPELFDRSERTYAATFARYGDLSYFTPVQRIGTYMEFQARLKRKHLMDLISYLRTANAAKAITTEEEEVGNVVNIMDSWLFVGRMPYESKPATVAKPKNKTKAQVQSFVEKSIVAGVKEEMQINKVYDASSSRQMEGVRITQIWSKALVTQLQVSMQRYIKYIESEEFIKKDEISQYKKEWMQKILDLIPDLQLQAFPAAVRFTFQEIFQEYMKSMREAILEYILRSPDERKRLHILMLPQTQRTAALQQALDGGYSKKKFKKSYNNKLEAEKEIKLRLITNNVVVSSLQSWWQEFSDFKLVNFLNFQTIVQYRNTMMTPIPAEMMTPGNSLSSNKHEFKPSNIVSYALDVDNFLGMHEAMLEKTVWLMKNIWHRGAILIVKKFKYMRPKELMANLKAEVNKERERKECGTTFALPQWTFKGQKVMDKSDEGEENFQKQQENVTNFTYKGGQNQAKLGHFQQYCLRTAAAHQNVHLKLFCMKDGYSCKDNLADFLEDITLDKLCDIRDNVAYIEFVRKLGGNINFDENGYQSLSKEFKRELKYAAGNLMKTQLRSMVDHSVEVFTNFFKGFRTFSQLRTKEYNFMPMRVLKSVPTQYVDKLEEDKRKEEEALKKGKKGKKGKGKGKKGGVRDSGTADVSNADIEEDNAPRVSQFDQPPRLKHPDFVDLQDYANPIIRLELLLGQTEKKPTNRGAKTPFTESQEQEYRTMRNQPEFKVLCEQLTFNYSDEQIYNYFMKYMDSMIQSLNEIMRPEFCKIKEYSKKKYMLDAEEQEATRKLHMIQMRSHFFHGAESLRAFKSSTLGQAIGCGVFSRNQTELIHPESVDYDKILYSQKNFPGPYCYEKYMGRIKLRPAPPDVQTKNLIDTDNPTSGLIFSQDKVQRFMKVAEPGHEFYRKHKSILTNVLREHLREAKRVLEIFEQFQPFISRDMACRVDKLLQKYESPLLLKVEYSQILKELRWYKALSLQIPERVAFPLFEVGTSQVKFEIQSRIYDFQLQVFNKFEVALQESSRDIVKQFEAISQELSQRLETSEQVVKMEAFKNNLLIVMVGLQRELESNRVCFFFLVNNDPPLEEIFTDDGKTWNLIMALHSWPSRINDELEKADHRHTADRERIEAELTQRKEEFEVETGQLAERVKECSEWISFENYRYNIKKVQYFQADIKEQEDMKHKIIAEELALFGAKPDFPALKKLTEEFQPYCELWTKINTMMVAKLKWNECPMTEIDTDQVDVVIKDSQKTLQKLNKIFQDDQNITKVLQTMQMKIQELSKWQPKIEVLSNKSLKGRHWEDIKQITGRSFSVGTLSLAMWETLNIGEKIMETIADISDKAKKQNRIEDMLLSMERDWNEQCFDVIMFRDSGIPILGGGRVEEMQMLLDEHVLVSATIVNNPDVAPILERANAWSETMSFTKDILDLIIDVQTNFLYLWPIFNTVTLQEEVKALLDSVRFEEVDTAWNKIMKAVQRDLRALSLRHILGLRRDLRDARAALTGITRNLTKYLESKQKFFPRFYFLPNEDLIEILGDSQQPTKVQVHLSKIFEGVEALNFQGVSEEITQLVSREGERVDLFEPIFPLSYDGQVECWLLELERQVKLSTKQIVTQGFREYPVDTADGQIEGPMSKRYVTLNNDRIKWISKWQNQVVLLVSQIVWTAKVEAALQSKSPMTAMKDVLLVAEASLKQIVNKAREKLPDLLRKTFSSLIVLEVHAKDIIEMLVTNGVYSVGQFDWIGQMRYYFNDEVKVVEAKMITTVQNYCFEYLGNTARLVITQLTEKCYRTLMSAMSLFLGGAPEGPAGTGKTETVKDLAKALGVYCMTFNCAEGLNESAMGKFFKGLCSSGTWSCFDEFNRIELEVLSVIAEQIGSITRAKHQCQDEFEFEGSQIRMLETANIFITMNPTYAGRSELPDNLKVLFRPVAMMVPDFAQIAEISLYSFGFFESRSLAIKIVATYRLCREQLSSQYHYDYGMRAVIAVLSAVQNLKIEMAKKAASTFVTFPEGEGKNGEGKSQNASVSKVNSETQDEEDADAGPKLSKEESLVLRSIKDVNLPKFVAPDIPLFHGVISDIFPGNAPPDLADEVLGQCIIDVCQKMNLQTCDTFVDKVFQLYEMIRVRHGLMLVGREQTGKTSVTKVLQKAITQLAEEDPNSDQIMVESHVINPKAILHSQLYGSYDPISQEFADGIIGSIFRKCVYGKESRPRRRWVIFDGPVDPIWIEDMNTLLDENRKLCLMNGEVIRMTQTMTIMFETYDLSLASPATISRCGMIYMDVHATGGWWSLLQSWLSKWQEEVKLASNQFTKPRNVCERIEHLFEYMFPQMADGLLRYCNVVVPMTQLQLAASLIRILDILCTSHEVKQMLADESTKESGFLQKIDMYFIFAALWSLGATTDEEGLKIFVEIMRNEATMGKKIEEKKDPSKPNRDKKRAVAREFRVDKRASLMPDTGAQPANNYYIDEHGAWASWKDVISRNDRDYQLPMELSFNELIVNTTESLKIAHTLQMFLSKGIHTLLVGPTGTGKSVIIQKFLSDLPPAQFTFINVSFSAQSTSAQTQSIISKRLDKQGRGKIGPPTGKKCFVFVDDLNMPKVTLGAQPAIELLRQWMDYGSWFDYNQPKNPLIQLEGLTFVAAMNPPTGGKNAVTSRFLRHFNIVSCNNFDEPTLERIYGKTMAWHVKKQNIGGSASSRVLQQLVGASVNIFLYVREVMKPTPTKSHYLFNLRDLSRVIQGIQMMVSFEHQSPNKMVRTWCHEIARVFSDRLISIADQEKLFNRTIHAMRSKCTENYNLALQEILTKEEKVGEMDVETEKDYRSMTEWIVFTDLTDRDAPDKESRRYEEVRWRERPRLVSLLGMTLDDFNGETDKPMNLVLFNYAVSHLLRICRILRMARGHCLLIGMGGSGRSSLARLAIHCMGHAFKQPEINKGYNYETWTEEMKENLMDAGCDLKNTTFFLSDAQIKFEFMLEDCNSILNSGEIPNLYGADDKVILLERMRTTTKKTGRVDLVTRAAIMDYHFEKVRTHLHLVFAMSPQGNLLIQRIRNYPALVNCCNIDYFSPWPADALAQVASTFLKENLFDTEQERNLVYMCQSFHRDAIGLAEKFLHEQRTQTYITPTNYLDMIKNFQKMLFTQRKTLIEKKHVYEGGIERLQKTKNDVNVKQAEKIQMQPRLVQSEQECHALMARIQYEQAEFVEPLRKKTEEEEAAAGKCAELQASFLVECEAAAAAADPILEKARKSINQIKKPQIDEIRSLTNPPTCVRVVLHAVCIMCQRPVERTPSKENPKLIIDNWWYTAQKFMQNTNAFFTGLTMGFEADKIPDAVIQKIRREFLPHEDFQIKRVEAASKAAKGLCQWIINLEAYNREMRKIKPIKDAAGDATYQLLLRQNELKQKRAELVIVTAQFEALKQKLTETEDEREDLKVKIAEAGTQIKRAQDLLDGLSGERERWGQQQHNLENDLRTIVSDMLLSAAIVSYLGPYTQTYRQDAIQQWRKAMARQLLPLKKEFSLERVLGDPGLVMKWQQAGLPADSFSTENGIIMSQSQKWPLLIDPQTQANRWIKGLESNSESKEPKNSPRQPQGQQFKTVKPSDGDFTQKFEQCIRMGMPLLLESVGEQIDTILDPVLSKQVFKVAGMKQIKFGDNVIDYADEFRLYMTSRHSNPHYLPDISIKVQIINFSTTFEGLQEQLLNLVVKKENASLDDERRVLIQTKIENTQALKTAEEAILAILNQSEGRILENDGAVGALRESQDLAEAIKMKADAAKDTEERLERARQAYTGIANLSALLFFIVQKLHLIDVMYQYSLSWFIGLFSMTVDGSQSGGNSDSEQKGSAQVNMLSPSRRSSDQRQSARQRLGSESASGGSQLATPRSLVGSNTASAREHKPTARDFNIQRRVKELIELFTYALYSNICRSIFEKDKLLFAFLLTSNVLLSEGKLDKVQYELLISTLSGLDNPLDLPNPALDWLPTPVWNKLCTCAKKDKQFLSLVNCFRDYKYKWSQLYDTEDSLLDDYFPANEGSLDGKWSPFMKLCVLKALRPDKLPLAIKQFIEDAMGTKFLIPPVFDLNESFSDSTASTPLIFVLPGNDPNADLDKFAEAKKKLDSKFRRISLGQNQSKKAEEAIKEARRNGNWVLLMNCHLYPSWMTTLEQICESLETKGADGMTTHPTFRLFLTSYPSEHFPVTILQNGIKMTNEPPNGLKPNMLGSIQAKPLSDPEFFNNNAAADSFKKLAYSMCMFHAIIQQRRNFGSLGWNAKYQFSVPDLSITINQLWHFTNAYKDEVPFDALSYMVGQCNYGGRITEKNDMRVLTALLKDFLGEHILSFNYSAVKLPSDRHTAVTKQCQPYIFPQGDCSHNTYIRKIQAMPQDEPPHLFGFHPNAEISKNIEQAQGLLNLMLKIGQIEGITSLVSKLNRLEDPDENPLIQTKKEAPSYTLEKQKEQTLRMMCLDILGKLPDAFELDDIKNCFPIKRTESLHTVIQQETEKYNKLTMKITDNLGSILLVQKGEAFVTKELEETMDFMNRGLVPLAWLKLSYPSQKPLASYLKDLVLRLETYSAWVESGQSPVLFWISGFFFTQSFLTAVLQNYARAKALPIDCLQFDFHFLEQEDPTDYENEIFKPMIANQKGMNLDKPKNGALISGIWFECARWDLTKHCITEMKPKQLYSRVPLIWLLPAAESQIQIKLPTQEETETPFYQDAMRSSRGIMYDCPLYQTSLRKNDTRSFGVNFVSMVKTPLGHEHQDILSDLKKPEHWIKRGAAMLCQLSD